ncbi:MFS transporter [Microbacterium sp. EST19A]|uniref:MFS transporter n=1 Tax=Microbacterium sp. EST19A TaxID=2862681 RepID=UPI001CBB0F38|nr:MFS transporter [Microbacterium sp. EST19A]
MTSTSSRPLNAVIIGCLGILIAYLPVVGVPVILGDIAASTGAETSDLQWVTASGLLALAAAVLSAGVASDMLGHKRVLIAGFGLVAAGSLIGVLSGFPDGSDGLLWLYAGQVLIGLGGGALLTSTLSIVGHAAASTHQRTFFISLWASGLVIGSGLGPFVAGVVTLVADWNWMFLPLAVISVMMIPVAAVSLRPSARVPGRSMDLRGQLTAIVAVIALVFSIIQGPVVGWGAPQTVIGFVLAAALTVTFVFLERSAKAPLVRMDIFHSAGFVVSALAAMAILFAIVGIAFVLTLFLTRSQHLSVLEIATRLGFLYLFAAITGPVAGHLQRTIGSRVFLVAGLAIAAAGVAVLSGAPEDATLFDLAWPLSVTGVGVGAVFSTVSSVAVHSVPTQLAGMAGATNTLFRQIGAALGPAIAGTVVATQLAHGKHMGPAMQLTMSVIATTLFCSAVIAAIGLFVIRRRSGASDADGGHDGSDKPNTAADTR